MRFADTPGQTEHETLSDNLFDSLLGRLSNITAELLGKVDENIARRNTMYTSTSSLSVCGTGIHSHGSCSTLDETVLRSLWRMLAKRIFFRILQHRIHMRAIVVSGKLRAAAAYFIVVISCC